MRRLAGRLGCEAMSLYAGYVRDKADLIDALLRGGARRSRARRRWAGGVREGDDAARPARAGRARPRRVNANWRQLLGGCARALRTRSCVIPSGSAVHVAHRSRTRGRAEVLNERSRRVPTSGLAPPRSRSRRSRDSACSPSATRSSRNAPGSARTPPSLRPRGAARRRRIDHRQQRRSYQVTHMLQPARPPTASLPPGSRLPSSTQLARCPRPATASSPSAATSTATSSALRLPGQRANRLVPTPTPFAPHHRRLRRALTRRRGHSLHARRPRGHLPAGRAAQGDPPPDGAAVPRRAHARSTAPRWPAHRRRHRLLRRRRAPSSSPTRSCRR